jgi:hypothetical protein
LFVRRTLSFFCENLNDGSATLRVDPDWSTRGELLGVTRYSDLAGATKVGSTSHTYDAAEHLTAINQPPQSRAAQGGQLDE